MLNMTEHDEQVLKRAVEELFAEQSSPLQKGLPLQRIEELLDAQFALKAEMDNPEVIVDKTEMHKLLLKHFRFEYGTYCLAEGCCR
ncbi:hypothetical protein [Ectobacillus ponti]|uniref:Uncharacterized protein n=1 Tax=Ectobacillus ponti TaxID=2961894 RepID=A0AA42BNV3_9BACI|nr:hypothetical protein [Ectobacillus ponti]MCP8968395.1 hypothetical protein [Ectobacillus ponti]